MRNSKVSVRGQTVIPKEIREQLGIKSNTVLAWFVQDGVIRIVPIPDDPIAASVGILKGSGFTFEDFMADRAADRELERQHEERLMKQISGRTNAGTGRSRRAPSKRSRAVAE